MKINKILTILAIFLLNLWLCPKASFAQSGLDLSVSPPVAYLHVKPGSQVSHIITIENTSGQDLKITPSVRGFSAHPETGFPVLEDNHSFGYFVNLEEQLKSVVLKPTQKAQLSLVIAPPTGVEEKEYPLTVVFEVEAAGNIPTQNSQLHGSVASNLIILVSEQNQIAKKLTLSELGTPKIIDSFQPLTLRPVFKNENLAATQASGSAVIKNWLGTEVARFELFPDNVLGFSQRPARALDRNNLDSLEPADLYFDPKLLLGPYTIEYSLYNQDEVKIIKATVVAIPFLILAAILAGGGVAIWYKHQVIRKNPFI